MTRPVELRSPQLSPPSEGSSFPEIDRIEIVAVRALQPIVSPILPAEKFYNLIAEIEGRIKNPSTNALEEYANLLHKIGPNHYPEMRLEIIIKLADYFLHHGQLKLAARSYNAAYQFAQEIDKTDEISPYLIKPIKRYLAAIGQTKPLDESSWKRHRENLAGLRAEYKALLKASDIRQAQRRIAQIFTQLVQDIVNSCTTLLGPPPCKYCFISLGSLSREEVCPYSDIECGILFEEPSDYFQQLATLVELYLINMGETDHQIGSPEKGCVQVKSGFSLDVGGMTPSQFQNTPSAMALIQKAGGGDPIHNNALREAGFMFGADSLFMAYQTHLDEILEQEVPKHAKTRRQKMALDLLVDHMGNKKFDDQGLLQLMDQQFSISLEQLNQEQELTLNIKEHLCRFIPMSLGAIALYKGIQETNSLDRIAKLKELDVLSPLWADKLQKWLTLAFRLRIETHLYYQYEEERLSLIADPRSPQDKMVSMHDRHTLNCWAYTILLPFRSYLSDWLSNESAFLDPRPLLAPLIALGKQWLNAGNLRKAQTALEEALEYSPVEPQRRHEIALLLADVHRQLGDGEQAAHYYDQAVKAHTAVQPMVEHYKKTIDETKQEHQELLESTQPSLLHTFLKENLSRFEQYLAEWHTFDLHAQGVEKRLLNLEQACEQDPPLNPLQLRVVRLAQLAELMRLTSDLGLQEALLKTQQNIMTSPHIDSLSLSALMRMALTFAWDDATAIPFVPHGTSARDFIAAPLLKWMAQLLYVSKEAPLTLTRPVFAFVFRRIPDELKPYFLNSLQSSGDGSNLRMGPLLDYPLDNGFRLGALAQGFQWQRLLDHTDMGYPDKISNTTHKIAALLPAIRLKGETSPVKMALLNSLAALLPILTTTQELFIQVAKSKGLFSFLEAPVKPPLERLVDQINALIQQLQLLLQQYTAFELSGLEKQLFSFVEIISNEYQRFLQLFNSKGEEEKAFLLKPHVRLSGLNTGRLILHEDWGETLIQLANAKKDPAQFGRHNVLKRGPFHFKVNPELPGIEYAIWSLNQLVTGQGSPPHDLLRLSRGAEHHVVLLSQTVPGKTLLELLTHTPEKLKLLDLEQYSQMILMALLTNPEDGKPDNYIAKEIKDSQGNVLKLQIIGVDNDHAFVSPLKPQKSDKALVKTILYCLDQMRHPIDPAVRRRFLSLNSAELLKRWLLDLQAQNKRYLAQFGQQEIEEYFKRDPDFAVVIPIYLKKGLVSEIYSKMQKIQEALRFNAHLTHLDLLLLIHPSLGHIYEQALEKKPSSPSERFAFITQGEYQISTASHVLITKTKSKQMLISMTGVNPQLLGEFQKLGYTPGQSLKELREIVLQTAGLDKIQKDLIDGDGKIFEVVAIPDIVEKILEKIDFSLLTVDQQRRVISRIERKAVTKLFLHGCTVLDDPTLKRLLQASPELTVLDLSHCSGITDVSTIEDLCSRLVYLNLSGNTGLKAFSRTLFFQERNVSFPHLRRLFLDDCPNLSSLYLSANVLKVLSLNKCTALKTIQMENMDALEKVSLLEIDFPLLEKCAAQCPKANLIANNLVFSSRADAKSIENIAGRLQGLTSVWGVHAEWGIEGLLREKCPTLKHILALVPFGKAQWERFFGDVGVEPPLPSNIEEILNSPCPFWEGKKVQETHLLTFIPQAVNGRPLTLDSLGEMIQRPKQGSATNYKSYSVGIKMQFGHLPVVTSHWVLMTRDVIPGSRGKSYSEQQQQLVVRADNRSAVPMLLDAAASIFMAYFAKGERLYGRDPGDPLTYTRCQERVDGNQYQSVCGDFGPSGLSVYDGIRGGSGDDGVAASWKF